MRRSRRAASTSLGRNAKRSSIPLLQELGRVRHRIPARGPRRAQRFARSSSWSAAWAAVRGLRQGVDRTRLPGRPAPSREATSEYSERILCTNFRSPASLLLHLAIRDGEAQGHGHLAAITSVAGERGRPRNYCYGAAKGGLTRYLQGLRSRLYGTGILVHNIKLGPVPTPMSEGHPQNFLWGEKTKAAKAILRALDRRTDTASTYLAHWALVMMIVRVLPEFVFQRFGFLAGR